ncbi:DUF5689 domain-containing protein [Pedobacter sp. MC2016-05]|uniref:DUF5689 domain-containing protein n=1 Tax=Pedobacter sp. MC2016-05 TaxID=2994474 RepID=UPI00224796AD|nr:DUF5689 domain-containing protein [Pedobacter sp. MC2016-05]MCX2476157.1 DUF5689 domain-containing protein [Pedobacter sp. MC2016-05]
MKKILKNALYALVCMAFIISCKRDSDYVISTPSSFIPNFDLRKIYTNADVSLNLENMRGASMIKGQVISDHSTRNLPAGLLIIQNTRIVGGADSLRGIAINIGADAAKYVPGDSVHVKIDGGVLKRVNGSMQITGKSGADVTKIASGKTLFNTRGFGNLITTYPDRYDCTLLTIYKCTFNPTLPSSETLSGEKTINDGTADLTLATDPSATFANVKPPYSGNYRGIIINKMVNDKIVPQHRLINPNDINPLSSTVDAPECIISGFISDVNGGDGNNEYVQLRATKDINFAVTPFSLVVSNNAGASVPTGVPAQGWATGQQRTYKINLTSGTVVKGEFFYVGGINKLINGANSTSIASSKWIRALDYNKVSDRFNSSSTVTGNATTGLFANSGNAFGMALFRGIEVTQATAPIDVLWVHSGGSLYQIGAAPNYGAGYRIGNTDIYDIINPQTLVPQPYYRAGTNTQSLTYALPADAGYFYVLGGAYDTKLNKWVKARTQTTIILSKTSTITEIEGANATEIR